jgi:hypothetical protein
MYWDKILHESISEHATWEQLAKFSWNEWLIHWSDERKHPGKVLGSQHKVWFPRLTGRGHVCNHRQTYLESYSQMYQGSMIRRTWQTKGQLRWGKQITEDLVIRIFIQNCKWHWEFLTQAALVHSCMACQPPHWSLLSSPKFPPIISQQWHKNSLIIVQVWLNNFSV